eukprot:COSAG05_NODE_1790_length_4082_cov_21.604162_1_plen_132_part_10
MYSILNSFLFNSCTAREFLYPSVKLAVLGPFRPGWNNLEHSNRMCMAADSIDELTVAAYVWAVNRFGWLKRLCIHALKLGLASGGLVLTCSVMDMGATLLGYTTALLVELTKPQIKLAILGGATAFLLVIAA